MLQRKSVMDNSSQQGPLNPEQYLMDQVNALWSPEATQLLVAMTTRLVTLSVDILGGNSTPL